MSISSRCRFTILWRERVAPQRLTIAATTVKPILPYNEANENGEQDFYILFPVFGGVVARQKSKLSMV